MRSTDSFIRRKAATAALSVLVCIVVLLMVPQPAAAKNKMVSFFRQMQTRDNYLIRYGVWPCDRSLKKGTVVLLGGRTEFMEKYSETISELNHKGFDVYALDWRGQGLSSRMLPNRHKGFVKTYDDYMDDLARFVDTLVKPAAASPIIIMAHSMGGHVALRYLHDHPGTVARAVIVSPMIDVLTSPVPRMLARLITRWAISAGWEDMYAIGNGDYDSGAIKFEGNRLTRDRQRFMVEKKAVEENPDLALGGVTYGWLSATFASIEKLTQPGFAAKIRIPVLMVGAESDKIVSIEAQQRTCSRMGNCRFYLIPDARHEILMETDAVRSIFWDQFDMFIENQDRN